MDPPELLLCLPVLGFFTENMMLQAKWGHPGIVRLLANPCGKLPVTEGGRAKMRGVNVAALATDRTRKRANPLKMIISALAWPPAF